MRKNKTVNNLTTVWEHLDKASESLYNAGELLGRMTIDKELKDSFDRVDISAIDSVKELIEQILENKEKDTGK